MADIEIIIDQDKLRQQMEGVVGSVVNDMAIRLFQAAQQLSPELSAQRDRAIADQAIQQYKAANGLS